MSAVLPISNARGTITPPPNNTVVPLFLKEPK